MSAIQIDEVAMTKAIQNIQWQLLMRYRMIEIIAFWEGRLTTNHLIDAFGIGRQQASKDIAVYKHEIAPDNLHYDSVVKGYVPTHQFKAVLTNGLVDEYIKMLQMFSSKENDVQYVGKALQNAEVVQVALRNIDATIFRSLVRAIKEKSRIDVDYVSVSSPDREGRIIAPHTIVNTGQRWHVRAWCEKNQDFRDFVLSRFRGEPQFMGESEKRRHHDVNWNTMIDLHIIPDQRLSALQQSVIAHDYGMTNGRLVLSIRASLVHYLLQQLNIDPHVIHAKPEAQQIVIANLEELKPFLFS